MLSIFDAPLPMPSPAAPAAPSIAIVLPTSAAVRGPFSPPRAALTMQPIPAPPAAPSPAAAALAAAVVACATDQRVYVLVGSVELTQRMTGGVPQPLQERLSRRAFLLPHFRRISWLREIRLAVVLVLRRIDRRARFFPQPRF